jgi:hypothetical protein
MTASRAITCPSCGGTIGIKAAGYTVSVACLYCGTVLDVANDDVRIIAEYHQAVATLDIPLGRRGTLFGVEWEAIGWLERTGAGAVWQEYLLFNPYAGYRWLVNSEGAWQFGTMLTDRPAMVADEIAQWRGRPYELDDAPIQIVTRRVLGEFYWRVRSGDVVDAASFAAGQETLSCEWNDAETNWTQMVPITARQVRAAFEPAGPQGRSTPPQGFFARLWSRWADMPFAGEGDLASMFGVALAAVVVVLLVMALLGGNGDGMSGQTRVAVDGGTTHGEYGPMIITRPSQMVTIKLATQDFTNKWVDIDMSLVDRQTHQAITANATIQYYSGSDSDGAWSQGSHEATVHVADVPRGAYNLILEANAHTWRGDNGAPAADPVADAATPWATLTPAPVEMLGLGFVAEMGGMDWALFWTVAGLILIVPTGIFLYRLSQGRFS